LLFFYFMLLGGLQKTTLIDFPGRVACTVFTVGCNYRCPFCHNKDLVTYDLFKKSDLEELKVEDFFRFLQERRKIFDGVCITGGEPTIHKDLTQFCKRIKDLGLEVKLDSNGSNPKMLQKMIDKKLVNFISMDIKNPFNTYHKSMGVKGFEKFAKESVKIILQSGLEYEFRTTVVPTIHNKKVLVDLAKDLKKLSQSLAAKHHSPFTIHHSLIYLLQTFRPMNCLDDNFKKLKPFTDKEMKEFLSAVQKVLPNAKIRGGDQ